MPGALDEFHMYRQVERERASIDASVLANIAAAPQVVSPAVGFSIYNLRPFNPPVATPAISIGLIYLIIISFFSLKSLRSPHPSDLRCNHTLELVKLRKDVVRICRLVAILYIHQLRNTHRIIGRIHIRYSILEERCSVGVYDDSYPGVFIVDSLSHGKRIVVEV